MAAAGAEIDSISMSNALCARFATRYTRHARGAIVLAPPASGKTTYVRQQTGRACDWVDQDELYAALGLTWSDAETDPRVFQEQYERADRLSDSVRAYGLRVMGSLFWDLGGSFRCLGVRLGLLAGR